MLFMTSSGGLKSAELFRGRDAVLSGPAGGVVGMAETARLAGFPRVIGFDMGGTSTDVSHYAGDYERAFETEVAGVRLRVPMLEIHTVAAGGGSILAFDGLRMRAGPESAGADPGPLCYRKGGPLTVTDANVMAGKLMPEFFPAIFGPNADEPIDREGVAAAFAGLAERIGDGRAPEEVADGFIRIAVQNMASAIKKISVERGYDVTRYALNCFGSAGGQHACLIADTLGIETILIHPLSGLLSAYGMGLAALRASREQSIEAPLDETLVRDLEGKARALGEAVTEELLDQGIAHDDIALATRLHVRYEATDTALPVLARRASADARRLRARAHEPLRLHLAGEAPVCRPHRGRGNRRRPFGQRGRSLRPLPPCGGGTAWRVCTTTAVRAPPPPRPSPVKGEGERCRCPGRSAGISRVDPVLLAGRLARRVGASSFRH